MLDKPEELAESGALQPGAEARQVVGSTLWLAGSRALRLLLGAVVAIWVARYLQPDGFGLLASATAAIALAAAAIRLGLNPIVVRDQVRHPESANEILVSLLVLRLVLSVVGAAVVFAVADTVVDDPRARWVFGLSALTLIPKQISECLQLNFQAKTLARAPAVAGLISFAVHNLGRITLLLLGAGVVAFAGVAPVAEATAAAMLTLFFVAEISRPPGLRHFRASRVVSLIRENWPLAISQLAGIVYLRIDQVMLAGMSGLDEAGIYGAALRLSEIWYFVPAALFLSVRPALTRLRERDYARYLRVLQGVFSITTALALSLAVPMTFLAPPLVKLLYGAAYSGAAPVLAVHIWAAIFSFWRGAQLEWVVNENHLRYAAMRSVFGAACNVSLNLILIPHHGAVGAATATLTSAFLVVTLPNFLFKPARVILGLQMRSLLFVGLVKSFREVFTAFRGADAD